MFNAKAIVIVGDPVEGFEYYGPFDSANEAISFADGSVGGVVIDEHWWVVELESPEGE